MFWLPLLIGAATSRQADLEAQDRQRKLNEAMQAYGVGKAKESEDAINTMLAKQTPDARKAEFDAIDQARRNSLATTVDAVRASNPAPIDAKVSPDYAKAQETAANTVADRTKRAIEQLAAMGTPEEQQLQQAIRFGHTATAVDSANTAINNVGQAYRTSIANTVPNPTRKAIGSAMMAYGGGGF